MTGRQLLAEVIGEKRASEVYAAGYVCVPREPTKEMLDGAYYDALEEDAPAVWKKMIGVSEGEITAEGIPVQKG